MDQLNLISDESESLTAVKEEIRTDVYTTEEEAEERAEEIGCVGTHSHDDNGNMVYSVHKVRISFSLSVEIFSIFVIFSSVFFCI